MVEEMHTKDHTPYRWARVLDCPCAVVVLALGIAVLGCSGHETEQPLQDTGASDPDCNQAFMDALNAGACQPPASLVINFNLGSTEYTYIDDPYFEAIGAVGVFGPGVGGGAGGSVESRADSIVRVIESNGTCEVLCSYDIVTCSESAPVCLSFAGGGCLYCNDPMLTLEQCQGFLEACASLGEGTDAGGASTEGPADGTADSTSRG